MAKWKQLELPLSRNIVNQKPCTYLSGISEICSTIKGYKHAGVMISSTSPLKLPIWPVQKPDGLGEWEWVFISLTRWWFQSQVLHQCSFIAWANCYLPPSWITALWWRCLHNSVKLWAMLCRATEDRWILAESSDKLWSIGGRKWQHSLVFLPLELHGQ